MAQVQYWNGSQWLSLGASTASDIGLGNVTNESKTTMFTNPTLTGTVSLPSTTSIGNVSSTEIGYVDGVTSAIQTQLNNKSNKSTIVNATLLTASWTGASAPYSYSLTVTGVTTTSNQELIPTVDVTDAQIKALQGANITDAGQSANTISLKAWGAKPTIDLPIRVILRGDM